MEEASQGGQAKPPAPPRTFNWLQPLVGPALVTGGSGFVGSHLVARLVALGAPVRCLVRRTSSLAWLPHDGISLVYGDLATGDGLREAVDGVGLVFHVAGVTKARRPEDYYAGNLRATERLLRALEESGRPAARLVVVSSLAAVGPSEDGAPLTEDAEPRPLTPYGKSKLAAEQAVRASPLWPASMIVRPPVVYGPRDTDVFQLFRAAAAGLLVRIGKQDSRVSVIFVEDLVDALLAAARSGTGGRTYFAASEEPVTWTAFGLAAGELMGRRVRCLSVPPGLAHVAGWLAEMGYRFRRKPGILSRDKVREARCRYWVCDPSRALRELGFCARTPLRDGMARTIAWYREAGWLR